LTGHAPFIGKNVLETLSMHARAKVPDIPAANKVPKWLDDIVHKSLEKELDKRFQSIEDLGGALQDGFAYSQRAH
jgi:serine/threonine protein kinase